MSDDAMLKHLVALNGDLDRMTDLFAKLVKSARVDDEQSSVSSSQLPPGDLVGVVVEGLVSRAYDALERIDSLQKAMLLGNADRKLYERVRSSQHRLRDVSSCASMFTSQQGGPMTDAHRLLNKLEAHYYSSRVPVTPVTVQAMDGHDAVVERLCSQALQSMLSTPSQSTGLT
jgi:hypothetical protein